MANNRLYLRCKNCGQSMLVAKNFGGEWDYRNANKIPEFLINHNFMCYWDCDDVIQWEFIEESKIESYTENGDKLFIKTKVGDAE